MTTSTPFGQPVHVPADMGNEVTKHQVTVDEHFAGLTFIAGCLCGRESSPLRRNGNAADRGQAESWARGHLQMAAVGREQALARRTASLDEVDNDRSST